MRARPEGINVTGWLCAVAGGLTVLAGAAFALAGALARALAQQGTDIFSQPGAALDPLSRTLLDHFGAVAAVMTALGLSSLIIGIQFLRMRPAARLGLEVLAWVVLAGTVLLEIAGLTTWKQNGAATPGVTWLSSPVTSLTLTFLQILACVLVIRFVRSPPVRAAFRAGRGD